MKFKTIVPIVMALLFMSLYLPAFAQELDRIEPIVCDGLDTVLIERKLIDTPGDGIRASGVCSLRIVDSQIRAGGHAVRASRQADVFIENSLIIGGQIALSAQDQATIQHLNTTLKGALRQGILAEIVDLGGSTMAPPQRVAPSTAEQSAVKATFGVEPASGSASPGADCSLPTGTYRYLFADDIEAFYFNDEYTIRVTEDSSRIVLRGDFRVELLSRTYERRDDTFVFTNEIGRYTSIDGNETTYVPSSAYTIAAAAAPIGFQYTDEYGTYLKASDSRVIFTPRHRLDDLVIKKGDCMTNDSAGFNYDAVIRALGAEPVGDQLVVKLDSDVLFDFDSSAITPRADTTLAQLAFLIRENDSDSVLITGHTDSKGTQDYNMRLSESRATAVAAWLTSKAGVKEKTIKTVGMGETRPVAHNKMPDGSDNPEGRAQNRRVEVSFNTGQTN